MLTALTSMAYVTTNSFHDIAGARQRQTAIALADEAIEQARALPLATIRRGVRSVDLAGDPRVLGAGTAASPYVLATTGEQLVAKAPNAPVAPIVPNLSPRTVDGVVYAVRFYVSHFGNDQASDVYTATAYVDWRSASRGYRATSVRSTTVINAPSSTLTPTGGVGQGTAFPPPPPTASFFASASIPAGQIRVSGSGSGGPALAGASNLIPTATASLARGQVSTLTGSAKGGGVVLGGVPLGFPTSATQADDDPGTLLGDYQFHTANGSSTSASAAAGPGTVTASVSGAPSLDTSESASAVAASADDDCWDPAGVAQLDLLPCQRAVGEQGGALRTTYDLTGIGLGAVALSEVTPPPTPTLAFAKHRDSAVASAPCAATSHVGCVHAAAARAIGRVRVGGLPAALTPPVGYAGYLYQLDGYADRASVEAGIGAGTNSRASSGELRYWNGIGYSSITLSSTSSFSVTTPVVSSSLGLYSVSVSSTMKHGVPTERFVPSTCLGAALPCVLSSEVVLGAPVIATTTYDIQLLGASVYRLVVDVDLGDLRVAAAFTP